ncbi:M23 family metallopeptidase [Jeotgalibacillus proteolyticus]|uniref:M23 family metallopeptidase n=1 Tax=Jeotgalibacillus proteolyticus TaxID=2082395 RepID=UPI003CE80C60
MKKVMKYLLVLVMAFGVFNFVGENNKASAATFNWPSEGTITAGYKDPDYLSQFGRVHYGIDIAKSGTVNISASAAGVVTRSYYSSSYGHTVFIKHNIGGQTYETVYAHLRSASSLDVGDSVSQGQFIGYMGSTGLSTGQHLHFELHKGLWNSSKSNSVDPLDYLGETLGGTPPAGDPANNPSNGSYAYVKVDYVEGYGVNLYNNDGEYAGKANHGVVFSVYGEKPGYYSVGAGKWLPKEYAIYKPFKVHSAYPEGWGVNVYKAPDGAHYMGKLEYRDYDAKEYRDGYFKLDDDTWVRSKSVIVTKPKY